MKILIDDGLSLRKKLTGIGWYTKEVIQALKEDGVTVEQPVYPSYFEKLPNFLKRFLYVSFYVKKNIENSEVDYIHYTNFYCPPQRHKAKVIVTIHDLSPFLVPDTFPWIYRGYAQKSILNAVKYADKIVADSDSVAIEIKQMFPEYAEKVTALYNLIRFPLSKRVTNSQKKEKIFLYVGVIEKRKNLKLLCNAFNSFVETHQDAKLILIGKPGFGFDEVQNTISNNSSIIYKNYVTEEELMDIYRKALAFVFPTIYEGFGKPLIEAMYFNLPIISSDIPTNKELNDRHDKKYILFEKNNVADLISALDRLYRNEVTSVIYPNLDVYSPENFKKNMAENIYNF